MSFIYSTQQRIYDDDEMDVTITRLLFFKNRYYYFYIILYPALSLFLLDIGKQEFFLMTQIQR